MMESAEKLSGVLKTKTSRGYIVTAKKETASFHLHPNTSREEANSWTEKLNN